MTINALRCRLCAATSCRCRQLIPRSRSPANVPTTWHAKGGAPVLGAPSRPRRSLRTRRPSGRRHRGVRGTIGQGRLHAQPRARPGCVLCVHLGSRRSPASPAGRPVRRSNRSIKLDKICSQAGDTAAGFSGHLMLPVATALADIPALALTEAEAYRPVTRPGNQPGGALMGRIPGSRRSLKAGLARAMAGSRVLGLCRLEDGWLKPERLL